MKRVGLGELGWKWIWMLSGWVEGDESKTLGFLNGFLSQCEFGCVRDFESNILQSQGSKAGTKSVEML